MIEYIKLTFSSENSFMVEKKFSDQMLSHKKEVNSFLRFPLIR